MLRAEDVWREYGAGITALRGVSFALEGPRVVGLLGRNGAGKSTLLRLLAGLHSPHRGRVRLEGLGVRAPESRARIGFLPERAPLHEEMTAREQLAWCARLRGVASDQIPARLERVARTCGIVEVLDRALGELSHGYGKRVGIAQAIMHDPALVLLDEPISGLDPAQIVEARAVIRALGERALVVVSSHILAEIAQTCDHVLVLRGGELVADGPAHQLGRALEGDARPIELEGTGPTARARATLQGCELVARFACEEIAEGRWSARALLLEDRPEAVAAAIIEAGLGLRRLGAPEPERGIEAAFLRLTLEEEEE